MEFRLTLVRHGESVANVNHMLSGWMDVSLTEHGRAELIRMRESLRYPESEAYFSSSLTRCVDTSHLLFPDKSPVISDDYKEINFRSLEGHVLANEDEMLDYFSSWVCDVPMRDEETLTPVMDRARKAFLGTVRKCEEEGGSSATIVTHSGIMRALVISLFNLEKSSFLSMNVPNGLGYLITFDGLEPLRCERLDEILV